MPVRRGGAVGLAEHRRPVQVRPRSAEPGGRRTADGTPRAPCRPPVSRRSRPAPERPTPHRRARSRIGAGRVQSAARPSRPTDRVCTAACRKIAAGSSWCQTYRACDRQRNRRRSVIRRKTMTTGSQESGKGLCPRSIRSRRPTRSGPSCGRDRPTHCRRDALDRRCAAIRRRAVFGTNSQHIRPSPKRLIVDDERSTRRREVELALNVLAGKVDHAPGTRRAGRSFGCHRWSERRGRPTCPDPESSNRSMAPVHRFSCEMTMTRGASLMSAGAGRLVGQAEVDQEPATGAVHHEVVPLLESRRAWAVASTGARRKSLLASVAVIAAT